MTHRVLKRVALWVCVAAACVCVAIIVQRNDYPRSEVVSPSEASVDVGDFDGLTVTRLAGSGTGTLHFTIDPEGELDQPHFDDPKAEASPMPTEPPNLANALANTLNGIFRRIRALEAAHLRNPALDPSDPALVEAFNLLALRVAALEGLLAELLRDRGMQPAGRAVESSVDLGEFVALTIAKLAGVDDTTLALWLDPGGLAELSAGDGSVEAESAAAELLATDEYAEMLIEFNEIADAMTKRHRLSEVDLQALQGETEGPWGDEHGLPTPPPRIVIRTPPSDQFFEMIVAIDAELDALTARIAALEAVLADPIPECVKGQHWSTYPLHICTSTVGSVGDRSLVVQ